MKFCFAFFPNILFHLIGEIPLPGRFIVKFFSVKMSPLKIFFCNYGWSCYKYIFFFTLRNKFFLIPKLFSIFLILFTIFLKSFGSILAL